MLDVRTPYEVATCHLAASGFINIPIERLSRHTAELEAGRAIVTCCRVGYRAYLAQKMLERAGFGDVSFLEGSMATWPYKTMGNRPR